MIYTLQMDLPSMDEAQRYDLYMLMDHFHRPDIISGYRCAYCDVQQSSEKKLAIITPPKIFVVTLSRFRRLVKIDDFVRFPEELTIRYTVDGNEYHTLYRITGIIIHSGSSIEEGHYFAYVRVDEKWFRISDDNVTAVRWQTVRRKKAYMLFYQKHFVGRNKGVCVSRMCLKFKKIKLHYFNFPSY